MFALRTLSKVSLWHGKKPIWYNPRASETITTFKGINEVMLNALRLLNSRDKLVLAVFFSLALLCALYFASGILVTYISSPAEALEMSKDGTGFTVRVYGFSTYSAAEQLSNALLEQRKVKATIEPAPGTQGYLVKVGPLTKREAADQLSAELRDSGYGTIKIAQYCAPGADCPPDSTVPLNNNQPANKEK